MPRLEELRKFALIALIASVVGTLVALWNFSGTTISLVTRNHRTAWQFVPLALIDFLVTASMPVFYFALFRRYWEVRIPPRVRPMAFGGALAVVLYIVVGLPQTWGTLRGAWNVLDTLNWRSGGLAIFAIAHDPRCIGFLLLALGEFSNVAVMLVLIALFRQRVEGQSESEPASRLLNSATRAAVLLLGLWAAFNLVRLLASPYMYFVALNIALENRLKPLSLAHVVSRANIEFLASISQFAAPYVVYKSLPEET